MTEEQLDKVAYEVIEIPVPETNKQLTNEELESIARGPAKKYIDILKQWSGRFKTHFEQKQMSEQASDQGAETADGFVETIQEGKINKLYIMSYNEAGEEKVLSIYGTYDLKEELYLAFGVAHPESQLLREFRANGTVGKVGEPNRLRALTGLARTARARELSGDDDYIQTYVYNQRAQVFEKYGFTECK